MAKYNIMIDLVPMKQALVVIVVCIFMYGMNKRLCCLFDACCVVLYLFFSSLGQFCNKMEIANVCLIGIER